MDSLKSNPMIFKELYSSINPRGKEYCLWQLSDDLTAFLGPSESHASPLHPEDLYKDNFLSEVAPLFHMKERLLRIFSANSSIFLWFDSEASFGFC